jgi:hypothetical protein
MTTCWIFSDSFSCLILQAWLIEFTTAGDLIIKVLNGFNLGILLQTQNKNLSFKIIVLIYSNLFPKKVLILKFYYIN